MLWKTLSSLQAQLRPVPSFNDVSEEHTHVAAVLIPLFLKNEDYEVIFVKRSKNTPTHKGQVAFPGGGVSLVDSSFEETALRELYEETSITKGSINIIGALPEHHTIEGSRLVIPIVGEVTTPVTPKPDGYEILDVFTDTLTNLQNHHYQKQLIYLNGGHETLHFFQSKYLIWGLTARILIDLMNRLQI